MKKIATLLLFTFLTPTITFAETNSEGEELKKLQIQITLLLEEVKKLQELLSTQQSFQYIREPLSSEEMRKIIEDGVEWFKNAQEENGHFKYEYLPYEDEYLDDDNIVRQAGGLYALGEIAVHDVDNRLDLKETLEKSVQFFERQSVDGNVEGESFRCIANSSYNEVCQLGATALAIIGAIDLVDAYPETKERYNSLIRDYGAYIVAMKKEGAGFRGSFNQGSPLSDKESSFSNGEALLALARYYMYDPNDEVKKVIDDTFDYFESDKVEFDFPLYLWVTAALKDMHALWENERYVTYTKDYTNWRLNGVRYRKGTKHNFCAYSEGIISAYSVLEDSFTEAEKIQLDNEINFWLDKSKSLQLNESNKFRVIKDESGAYFGEITNEKQAYGGFITGEDNLTQRIDYTQHCLNSYLQQLVDVEREAL